MSFFGSTNFLLEVAKGNVAGHNIMTNIALSPTTGAVEQDISFTGGTLVYPTGAESLEIVSASANDTAAGTGTQEVTIDYLNTSYVEQSVTVATNGGTVTTGITDFFRPIGNGLVSSAWGSGLENDGNITLQVSGGGNVRLTMEAKRNRSRDCYLTIPAGKVGIFVYTFSSVAKGDDSVHEVAVRGEGEGFISLLPFSNVGDSFELSLPSGSDMIQEKTDVKIVAKSSNNSRVSFAYRILLIDNDMVNQG